MLPLWLVSSFMLLTAASSLNVAIQGVFNEIECPLAPTDPSTYWYESITHNGISPFIPNGTDWPVFRNVKTMFGAKGDGITDDSDALQNAINAGNSYAQRNTNSLGTTGQPAVVYLPKGVYVLAKPIQFFVGMILMGDPINPPTIKAAGNFSGDFMIYAKDPSQDSTTNFYVGMKNVFIDSMDYDKDKNLTLVDWSVSQACQLANVRFNMPYESTGHIGVAMPEGGSGLILEDLYFHGGVVGIQLSNQQYHLKSLTFDGCGTGISVQHLFMGHCQGCNFTLCGIGVDNSSPTDGVQNLGTFIITDSTADNTGVLVNAAPTNGSFASIVLENVQVDEQSVPSTVMISGDAILKGSVEQGEAWVLGDAYTSNKTAKGVFQKGTTLPTTRATPLVDSSGSFYRLAPPTYEEYGVEQIVNVKEVPSYPVAGDGKADDTASLQAIINKYAGCKILFFPYGIYLVTDTLVFPPGSRVFGEAWSTISATGSRFINPGAPIPMIKVGESRDVGVAQFSDMLFTVEDILPGCTLLEVNMAGEKPGDVGFWNTHFRVGGAADSQIQEKCGPGVTTDPAQCKAAFMLAHFTASSSAYVDNMWGWTADHDLDGIDNPLTNPQYISVGRGVLIESTKPSWFIGFSSEHNTLYEVNINGAENVFIGFQQSETPYWQGGNSSLRAPDPWTPVVPGSDPDFSWCAAGDAHCRMSIYQRISCSKDLSLYAGGFWTFFNANKACDAGVSCQRDAVRIDNSTSVSYFGLGVNHVGNLIIQDDKPVVTSAENKGGWFANVAVYLDDS
ncbi:glycoside hydrolase family 55 protein [Annulohypoxylon truncatum]|uniref:glycoside hydrolase family 55 protein n=1 Tax=Annulohypoxylon truncatum TaxID=327061 RepID=UPI002007C049|nr:glycoside hydrolase family 55 protein [Annulohypoxylon truncatum]KAI1210462.1 glycoside hydrolase family 55 protein [Annulohypoxylon truncatum]